MKQSFLLTVFLFIGCGSGSNIDFLRAENEALNSADIKESGNYVDEAFFGEITFD
tara:strand:+ start:553 stop:717 length:165 start_codon:yes stop_codon:yes gene_type:complete